MWSHITDYLDHLFVPMFVGSALFPAAYLLAKYAFEDNEDIGWLFQNVWWIKPAFYIWIALVSIYPFTSPTFCQNVSCRSQDGMLQPKPQISPPIFNPTNAAPPVSR